MTENRLDKAIESYQQGLTLRRSDDLLLPCLAAMEQGNRKKDMLKLVRGIDNLQQRNAHLRWRVAQVFCEHQCLKEARKALQEIVDDEHVAPQLRQRANECARPVG